MLINFSKGRAILFSLVTFAVFSVVCLATGLAQEVAANPDLGKQVTDILALYAQNKGSAIGITFVVLQVVLKVLKTSLLDKLIGKYKLLIVAVLSFGGAIVANLVQGGGLSNMFGDGAVLFAGQILFNQAIKQFSKKG